MNDRISQLFIVIRINILSLPELQRLTSYLNSLGTSIKYMYVCMCACLYTSLWRGAHALASSTNKDWRVQSPSCSALSPLLLCFFVMEFGRWGVNPLAKGS